MGELIALSTPSASATGIVESGLSIDVRPLLGSLKVPVLVVHARGDMLVPLSAGRELAAGIPGARLVVVETSNHGLPPADDPTVRARDEIDAFLAEESWGAAGSAKVRRPGSARSARAGRPEVTA
jgi:pimeloyl-ACP methyl ester carboxylesterase